MTSLKFTLGIWGSSCGLDSQNSLPLLVNLMLLKLWLRQTSYLPLTSSSDYLEASKIPLSWYGFPFLAAVNSLCLVDSTGFVAIKLFKDSEVLWGQVHTPTSVAFLTLCIWLTKTASRKSHAAASASSLLLFCSEALFRPNLYIQWCWSWNYNTLATSCEELTHWKRPWCWEGLGAEGDNRGWDGWMASPTRWTWVWVNSGSWWTGRPGVLQFMGSQESDTTELNCIYRLMSTHHLLANSRTEGTSLLTYPPPESLVVSKTMQF